MVAGLAVFALLATAMAAFGSERLIQLLALAAACACIAAVVVLLPAAVRARAGLFMAAFVAAAGVLPIVVASPTGEPPGPNAAYTAELIRRGPFDEALPEPLSSGELKDVGIPDSSAGQALDTVQVVIEATPEQDPFVDEEGSGVMVFAHLETYPTRELAAERARASLQLNSERYEVGLERLNEDGFCIPGPAFWLCAGFRGLVYAEVTLSPNPNATLPLARGTLSALLRYADRMARLATG